MRRNLQFSVLKITLRRCEASRKKAIFIQPQMKTETHTSRGITNVEHVVDDSLVCLLSSVVCLLRENMTKFSVDAAVKAHYKDILSRSFYVSCRTSPHIRYVDRRFCIRTH